jgi:hypothetical protein
MPNALRFWTEPLLEAHYQESNRNRAMKLAPDWDKYRVLDEAGALLNVVAIEDAETGSRCVGYAVNILAPHLHYKNNLVSQNDVIFTTPDARASVGGRIMVAMRKLSLDCGASVMLWHTKPNTVLDDVLSRRFPVHERIYLENL